MSHNDKIKDMDAFFEVNRITRQIINRTPNKIVLMQNDHNSERFTFSLPRYIEGHDMSESKAKLHYINAIKGIKGMYEMKDLKVDPDDSEKVICSWLISGNVTKEAGALSFMIEFECYEGDVLVYSWHTQPHNGISVGEGFDNAEEIAKMYADVLQQWHDELFGMVYENGSPFIVSPDEAGKAVHIHELKSGAYVLKGTFDFGGEEVVFEKPTTCDIYKHSDRAYFLAYLEANPSGVDVVNMQYVWVEGTPPEERFCETHRYNMSKMKDMENAENKVKNTDDISDKLLDSEERYPSMLTMKKRINASIKNAVGAPYIVSPDEDGEQILIHDLPSGAYVFKGKFNFGGEEVTFDRATSCDVYKHSDRAYFLAYLEAHPSGVDVVNMQYVWVEGTSPDEAHCETHRYNVADMKIAISGFDRQFEKTEKTENKMETWNGDDINANTYPSTLAMYQAVNAIHEFLIEEDIGKEGKIKTAINDAVPFYEYTREVTSIIPSLLVFEYDMEDSSWKLTNKKVNGDYLGLKVGNAYDVTLQCWDVNGDMVKEHTAAITIDGTVDDISAKGVKLHFEENDFDVAIYDKSSTDYHNKYPNVKYDPFNALSGEISFEEQNIVEIEISIMGDFSRKVVEFIPDKFIRGTIARKTDVEEAIGNVGTALENIIKKYGLGGDSQ